MFLALRELRHARLRFALIGGIVTLIAWLVFLLSGLGNGLAQDNASTLMNMDADYILLSDDARVSLQRSTLESSIIDDIASLDDVEGVAKIGQSNVVARIPGSGDRLDAVTLGIEPGSFLEPVPQSGTSMDPEDRYTVLVDDTFRSEGVQLGDTVMISPTNTEVRVVGFVADQKYMHLPSIFVELSLWQEIMEASGGTIDTFEDPISGLAVQMSNPAADQIEAAVSGIEVSSLETVIENMPGYQEEMGTINIMLGFLFVIAALLIATFFYVIMLQKTHQIGVLKAMGASGRFLSANLISQILLITVGGIGIGAGLAFLIAAFIPEGLPFSLSTSLVLIYGVVLVVVALAGLLLSLRRMLKIDPIIAIGRVD